MVQDINKTWLTRTDIQLTRRVKESNEEIKKVIFWRDKNDKVTIDKVIKVINFTTEVVLLVDDVILKWWILCLKTCNIQIHQDKLNKIKIKYPRWRNIVKVFT